MNRWKEKSRKRKGEKRAGECATKRGRCRRKESSGMCIVNNKASLSLRGCILHLHSPLPPSPLPVINSYAAKRTIHYAGISYLHTVTIQVYKYSQQQIYCTGWRVRRLSRTRGRRSCFVPHSTPFPLSLSLSRVVVVVVVAAIVYLPFFVYNNLIPMRKSARTPGSPSPTKLERESVGSSGGSIHLFSGFQSDARRRRVTAERRPRPDAVTCGCHNNIQTYTSLRNGSGCMMVNNKIGQLVGGLHQLKKPHTSNTRPNFHFG